MRYIFILFIFFGCSSDDSETPPESNDFTNGRIEIYNGCYNLSEFNITNLPDDAELLEIREDVTFEIERCGSLRHDTGFDDNGFSFCHTWAYFCND